MDISIAFLTVNNSQYKNKTCKTKIGQISFKFTVSLGGSPDFIEFQYSYTHIHKYTYTHTLKLFILYC